MLLLWGFIALKANAQTDSLYIDTKPRDGITKLTAIASCQRQIITAEQIRLSGYTRVSDLIQLADAMTFTTLNYKDWFVQTNGTGTYQNQSWVLMVNGQRIDMLKLGITDLNAMGIAVQDIERIEIVNTPEMYLGEYADKGLVHIVTKKPVQGLSQHGSVSFRPNDSGIEFNTFQSVYYAKNNFSIGLTYNRNRNNSFSNAWPSGMDVFRLQINYGGKNMLHQLTASASDIIRNNISYDLNYNSYSLSRSANFGYLTQFTINNRNSIRLSTNLSEIPIKQYFTPLVINTYYFNTNLSYRYRKPIKKELLQITAGISLDSRPWYYVSSYAYLKDGFNEKQNLLIKPYVNYSRPINRKTWLNYDISLITNASDKSLGYKTTLSLYKRVSILTNWSLVAYAGQKNQAELNSTNYTEYSSFTTFSYNTQVKNQPIQYSINGNYAINMGNNFKLAFNAGFNYLGNEYFTVIAYPLNDRSDQKTNYFNARTVNNVIRFNIHHDVLENLYFDFNYMRTTPLGGHIEMASNIPKHKTTLILNYKLEKWLNVWSRNYYQSATTWYNYADPIILTSGYSKDSNKLESKFVCDIGITARSKNERLNLNLTALNLTSYYSSYNPTSTYNIYHFMVSLSWKFDGIFASSNGNQ